MTLSRCLILASLLFCIGLYGLLTRREAVALLLAVELMANAANIAFVAFGYFLGGLNGQIMVLFALAIVNVLTCSRMDRQRALKRKMPTTKRMWSRPFGRMCVYPSTKYCLATAIVVGGAGGAFNETGGLSPVPSSHCRKVFCE